MSKDNNHNENMQDYLDLLKSASEEQEKNEESSSKNEKNLNLQDATDVVYEDFFDDYKIEKEESNNINEFFEKKTVSAPPMVFNEKKEDENTKNIFKKFGRWFKKLSKPRKAILIIFCILLSLAIILVSLVGIFVKQKLNIMGEKVNPIIYDEAIYENIEIGDIEIDIGSEGFKQSLIDWATQGNENHMYSKNVINVLLIGADSRKGVNEGNTDVMMLISVNTKAKTLKMISFLRDSYLYIEGKKFNTCTKLNAAFSMGGPECLIKTIENNYKIKIDNYVMVNFESFKDIVDAMGGVTVDVAQKDAREVQNYFNFSIPVGNDVLLNGKQALAFCRIRKADSDVERTARQRQVIDSMMDKVKNSTATQLNSYIDILLPYVATGYTESEILSLGVSAITGGWAKYDRNQLSMPITAYDSDKKCAIPGDANMWIWVVDYEKAAYEVQMELYGESNINIKENRISLIDIYNGAEYSGSSSGDSGSGSGIVTTKPSNIVTTVVDTEVPSTSEIEETLTDVSEEDTSVTESTEVDISIEESTEPSSEPVTDTEVEIIVPSTTQPVTEVPVTEAVIFGDEV